MLLLIIFLPLFSFLSVSTLGFLIGPLGASYLTTLCISLTCIFSWWSFYSIIFFTSSKQMVLTSWIYTNLLQVNWGFLFDTLTLVMLCVVTTISTIYVP